MIMPARVDGACSVGARIRGCQMDKTESSSHETYLAMERAYERETAILARRTGGILLRKFLI